MNVAHDDELPVGRGDVGARAAPVHVQEGHLQGLPAKEPQAHLLVLQDLLHRHQGVARLLFLRQLRHAAQDDEVALAEAGDHLAAGFARLAVVVLGERTHLFARLSRLKVVLVAAAAAVHEGLALFQAAAVRPAGFVSLAGPLEAGQAAGRRQLSSTGQHARFVGVKMVPVLVALTVGEGKAIVPLWLVVPAHALLPAVIRVGTFETLFGWKRQIGVIRSSVLTFTFSSDHHQGEVRGNASPDVLGCARVDAGILELGVVYDQLADVSDDDVAPDVIWFHDGILSALQLLLPGDFRAGLPGHLTQEAGGLTHKHGLLGGTVVYGGELDVCWEGGL